MSEKNGSRVAFYWDGSPEKATDIIDWILDAGGCAVYSCNTYPVCSERPQDHHLVVGRYPNLMRAYPRDWILYDGLEDFKVVDTETGCGLFSDLTS